MTTAPIAANHAQFGQVLAFAERTLTESLRRHLAERQVAPETWYALKLIAQGGPGLAREELIGDLRGSRTLDADSTRELLARLEAEGLIRGDAEVSLTEQGQTFHRDLREYVTRQTAQLLSNFDPDDIDTTLRTVRAITEQVAAELAAE